MAKKYFKKEVVNTKVFHLGKPVVWERLAESYGVIGVDDADKLCDFLTELAGKHIGGVVEITVEQYGELKKKLPYQGPVPKDSGLRVIKREDLFTVKKRQETPQDKLPRTRPGVAPEQAHVSGVVARENARRAAAAASKDAIAAAGAGGSESKPAAAPQAVDAYFEPAVGRPKQPGKDVKE